MPKEEGAVSTIGRLKPRPIVAEMEESYLDYAMSVVVSRALPDARDGLKPVHRRILFACHQIGLRPTARFSKCAAVIGEVLKKYHPHGDAPVYEALVRLAQDFSMRYPLIQGQGNFGSIDGDAPAAMRYTEARMTRLSEEMLKGIEKDTVDFHPNYDGNATEPVVLPATVPQLLLNGTVGIAVGMATNVPPHNLAELCDACALLAEKPDTPIESLLEIVKGPDFPTAGEVYSRRDLKQAYITGRGSITIRGKAEIVPGSGGRSEIIISEIPFQVNKAAMIQKMADLVTSKVIQGVSDIRDESDRRGIRVVVEMKKDSYPNKVLNQFYKHTDLQTTFGYNMIALVDGLQPRLLNLKELLEVFLKHRRQVTVRRVTFERDRARERAHILEGLKVALDNIDAVIQTIKKSATKEEAKENLMKKFKLTEIQSQAILDMPLKTLAGLERKLIEDELKERRAFIKECEDVLADPRRVTRIIIEELGDIRKRYGDERRTRIRVHAVGELGAKETIPNAPMIVTLTREGYVKRLSPAQFRAQQRGGKGVKGMTTKEEDEILRMLSVSNHDDLLCFTNTGRVFTIPTYELPQGSRSAKGQAIVNLLQLKPEERVTAVMKADLAGKKYLFMATKQGLVKKSEMSEFENIRKSGLIAQKMRPGDELKWVVATSGNDQIFTLSKGGKAIRFPEQTVRPMGRAAAGVRGISLAEHDEVVEVGAFSDPTISELLVVMENGLSKMTKVTEYRLQGRGGSGVKAANVTPKTGNIIGGAILTEGMQGDLICISKLGQTIRLKISDIPTRSRATQGVIIMRLTGGDMVASISLILETGGNGEEGGFVAERGTEKIEESELEVIEEQLLEGGLEKKEVKEEIKEIEKAAATPPPPPPPPPPTPAASRKQQAVRETKQPRKVVKAKKALAKSPRKPRKPKKPRMPRKTKAMKVKKTKKTKKR
jgi:DNA gyrase subunit A